MQLAVPPVIERIIVLKHAPLSAEVLTQSLARWEGLLDGQLTRQMPPKTQWHIEIPAMADGAPEIEKMTVKYDVTNQYWATCKGKHKCCVQLRPEVTTFNLVSDQDGSGSYAALAEFAKKYFPLWEEAANIKTFVDVQMQYLNMFRPEHYAPFIENNKIQLNRIIKVFVGAIGDASYVVPYRHEFTIDLQQRKWKCLIDVEISMPNKSPVQLDLKITARTGGGQGKFTGEECLQYIIPTYHEYALDIFNNILTDEAREHCRITR